MKEEVVERDRPRPCDDCGTTEPGLYGEIWDTTTNEFKEWLCESCNKIKYPDGQRIH